MWSKRLCGVRTLLRTGEMLTLSKIRLEKVNQNLLEVCYLWLSAWSLDVFLDRRWPLIPTLPWISWLTNSWFDMVWPHSRCYSATNRHLSRVRGLWRGAGLYQLHLEAWQIIDIGQLEPSHLADHRYAVCIPVFIGHWNAWTGQKTTLQGAQHSNAVDHMHGTPYHTMAKNLVGPHPGMALGIASEMPPTGSSDHDRISKT